MKNSTKLSAKQADNAIIDYPNAKFIFSLLPYEFSMLQILNQK